MNIRAHLVRIAFWGPMITVALLWTGCDGTRDAIGPAEVTVPLFEVTPLLAAGGQTYTLDAEFDQGLMVNVNHDAPNNDQLQLNEVTEPFPFVNIAKSNAGTVVRIDVEDGTILGEYLTSPAGMGRNPSRTTVDLLGNVWVANRNESSGGKGSVVRVGLTIGGVWTDGSGNPDPSGQYLAPPFQYSTCVDRDDDGLIKTSRGSGNILPWTNAGGADTDGGVSTADDECIINYTRVTGTGTRTVAIDANNDVWVGGLGDLDHEKLDGVTGQPVPNTQFNLGCGGYGGLVDGNGVLWSARGGANLLRFEPNATPPPAGTGVCLNTSHGDYGIGIDPNTGHLWHSNLYGNRVAELAPDGTLLHAYGHGSYYAQGVAVDGSGNVWVAHSLLGSQTTVGHLRTDGTFVGNVTVGNGPTGVAVDANGKIWVANYHSHNAMRINPDAGPIGGGGYRVGAVDLTVPLGMGAYPYNYSDMTGFVAVGSTIPSGHWTIVQDGVDLGTNWGTVSWNTEPEGFEPFEGSIIVEVRVADTQAGLSSAPFVEVSNGVMFDMNGRYIEARATLFAAEDGTSPVLSDLTIEKGVIEVDIDIKPGSDPNSVNCENADEVITVAILTTEDFDATTVDHTTVFFEGASETHVDKKTGVARRHEEDVDGDGDIDLVLHFKNGETAIECGATEGTLTGETFEGRLIIGTDAVRTVPANT